MRITITDAENGFIVVKEAHEGVAVSMQKKVYVFQGFAPMTVWLAEEYKAIADNASTGYVYPG